MNAADFPFEKLVGKIISLQRADSLLPIQGVNPIARFIFLERPFLVLEEISGEQRGRTVKVELDLVVDVEPCADEGEVHILLRAPYTVEA
jgi:hypothetical protein